MQGPASLTILDHNAAPLRERDISRPIMLVGFHDQANLGLGYLSSTLRAHGYKVEVRDFKQLPEMILRSVKSTNPLLIGFSLIFQFYVEQFGALIRYLRDNGVTCHFTMGGHFPSLSFEETFNLVPELDSIVRFEGEITLLELADLLSLGKDWRAIHGIAYREANKTLATPLRSLVHDLDDLPYPDRNFTDMKILGRHVMPLLASRGCIRTCSFCSIHVFYRSAPGKVVRTRKPARVVEEMLLLHQRDGITVFLFQDDDFPLYGPVWQRWATEFVDELHRSGLARRVIWKINCRADVVDPEFMARMRDAGMYLVYMGLESGSEDGLATLHKQISVEQNLRAVEILKSLGIMFEYGFMLFDPSSTFESVRNNIQFLRRIVGSPASFCRMVPYDGTPIKDELIRTGRFKGDVCHPDYDFIDPRVDDFFHALNRMVHVSGWIHGIGALTPQLQYAKAEIAAMRALFPAIPGLEDYRETIRAITRSANELLFRVVEDVSYEFSDGKPSSWSSETVRAECLAFQKTLLLERNSFVADNQAILLRALDPEIPREATYALSS